MDLQSSSVPSAQATGALVFSAGIDGGDGAQAIASMSPPEQHDNLRVQVRLLDQLMNRAGEMVLARNQLQQTIRAWDKQMIVAACQRIDMVTSELQEIIMLTRMQQVGDILNKYPGIVGDMARLLDKEIVLEIEGGEVELDKAIIEGLGGPLTQLVRNAADHGIELQTERRKAGKSPTGHIFLRAFHESGQVIIEVEDDGKGLDPEAIAAQALAQEIITPEQAQSLSDMEKVNLIMLPGFSTADQMSEISGRGEGLDVVKTGLDKLGGQLEMLSQPGTGTTFRIKLPLTLAIIPSLLITCGRERFALPQVNVRELQRLAAAEISR
ncbi:MAG: hybrid sensor histidine kinase/response regulator, partial [Deltaproteobacteria bacterium]|nr:hybrid sensor histidine kinase/response regulator [Deltaproteobacteria bacterium]